MPELTYRQAVAAGLAQEMAHDDRVVLLGEDIASGGVFKTTLGLAERFGWSPFAVRLVFLLSCLLPGPQFLIYLALWLLLPQEP